MQRGDKSRMWVKARPKVYVPQEIIFEVLLRLPAKSLTRFKRVCKLWNRIISDDPKFAELYQKQKLWTSTLKFVLRNRIGREYWIHKFRENGTSTQKLSRLNVQRFHQFCFSDAADFRASLGPLLLFEAPLQSSHRLFMVYDCVNGKHKVLPRLKSNRLFVDWGSLLYDESFKNCKVFVCLSSYLSLFRNFCFIVSLDRKSMRVENNWRTLKPSPFWSMGVDKCNSICMKGISYCLVHATKSGERSEMVFIQPFDISKEKFTKTITVPLQYPERQLYQFATPSCSLQEIQGALCFTEFVARVEFSVWVLRDSASSSWDQLHKISLAPVPNRLPPFGHSLAFLRPVFVLENINNRLPLLLVSCFPNLYWYDMNTGELQEIHVESYCSRYESCLAAWSGA